MAVETTTNTDGSFTAGPLYDDISYIVEGSKVWNSTYLVIRRIISARKLLLSSNALLAIFCCLELPCPNLISFLVQPGYHIKQTGPNSFSCQKLGQISVRVYSKDDVNEPIPSVLLSLSGDDGYRNNSVSSTGGNFLFDNLFPGSPVWAVSD